LKPPQEAERLQMKFVGCLPFFLRECATPRKQRVREEKEVELLFSAHYLPLGERIEGNPTISHIDRGNGEGVGGQPLPAY